MPMRKPPPLGAKRWTAAEEAYLSEKWGYASIAAIARHLKRTEDSVNTRAKLLHLGPVLMGGDYVTLNQLSLAVAGNRGNQGYKIKSWVEKRGLPVHIRRVRKNSFRVVYLDEFWEWAEQHRAFIDFSKMEPLALGEEPDWVSEQRKHDFHSFALQRKDPWTPQEDSRLVMLLKEHRFGYTEISDMLHRSVGAIQRRCRDLGIKERPVREPTHAKGNEWAEEDFLLLADGIRNGISYAEIGRNMGRSEKAVRGKVYVVYLTECADKVRSMMGNGPWGHGAPEPTVKQAVHLSRCHTAVKKDLATLLFGAMSGGQLYFTMPESRLYSEAERKRDARTKRRGGS